LQSVRPVRRVAELGSLDGMKHPAIHNSFRIAFVCFGMCCFAVAFVRLSYWTGYKRIQSVAEVHHYNVKGVTNSVLEVTYMRPEGSQGRVDHLLADVKPGDHVTVLYPANPSRHSYWERGGVIYSFDTVWRIPSYAATIGAVSIALGLFFRRRSGGLFRVSHGHAV
jgi:hypothetical protein